MCDLSDLTKDDFYLSGLTADNCPPYVRNHAAQLAIIKQHLHPRDFPGKNTGVGCHFLLQEGDPDQGSVPTQGSNPGLLPYWQILYYLSHQGSRVAKILVVLCLINSSKN